jgi:hypothetical protein
MTENGWTLPTLKEHLQTQHDDLVAALNERQRVTEQRFAEANTLLELLNERAGKLLTREEYDAKHEALIVRISAAEHTLDQSRGKELGIRLSFSTLVTALGAIAAGVTVLVIIVDRLGF